MGCGQTLNFLRHLLFGIVLASFNLFSSLVNIRHLLDTQHTMFASLSLALLWTPGLVTSVGFLVLYARGNKTINRLNVWKLVLYPVLLLVLYPVIPIILTLAFLITKNEATHEKATLAKFFAGFLDHGPHFVLRLVIVVLVGVSQGGVYSRTDVVFILSMISSFFSFMLTALWFNERLSSWGRWFFLSGPMYSAVFACRAFTLAVFLKETLHDHNHHELPVVMVLVIMFLTNLGLFRHCGQDWTRSAVFGVASLLLPAGYNNDNLYYQVPRQDILEDPTLYQIHHRPGEDRTEQLEEVQFRPQEAGDSEGEAKKVLVPMRSARFLLLHTLTHTGLMGACAVYLLATRGLGGTDGDRDALVIPQLLGVVPGLFFALGTCVLMPDICPGDQDSTTRCQQMCVGLRRGSKVLLSVLLSLLGFFSLLPALFWTLIYKWFTQEDLVHAILTNLPSEE